VICIRGEGEKSSALFPIIYVLTQNDDGDKRKIIERANTAENEDKEISKLTIMSG
jgi:hypothetical protein